MTSQTTNRKEVVSTSYRGCSRKLRTVTKKELEALRVAQELLGGAPTIGGGVPGQGMVVEVVKEVK
jgi:hypothetical protein